MHEFVRFVLGELRGTWRFRWYALLVAWVVAIAGAASILTMPDQYRVESRVQIDTQSMLQPLLEDLAVEPNLQARIQILTATILNRENLEQIANENDLLVRARTAADEDRIIESLREEIVINQTSRDQIYRVSYQSSSPQQSRGVVQSVLDILLEEAMGLTRQDATTATDFLERQVEDYEQRLQRAEERLAEFKRENVGLLPDQGGGDYYQRLRNTEDELDQLESQKRTAERRVNSIQEQLTALRTGQDQPDPATDPRVQELDERIRDSRNRLDDMLLRYTEEHPDVRNLEAQLERMEERRENMVAQGTGGETRAIETNPVFQELQIRLNDWQGEIAALETQIEEQRERKDRLLGQVDEITEVETRLNDLTRTYENTRERYQALLGRLSTAEMTAQADATGGQMSMRLVDPPRTPEEPDGPPRALFLLAMLPVSLGVGGGVGFLLHQVRPVFQSRELLGELTGRPVLGSVSLVMTRRQKQVKLGAITVFGLGVMALAGAIALGAAFADIGADMAQDLAGRIEL